MSVSYDIFTNAFLSKVTEYNFIPMDPHDRNSVIDGYMKRACAQFNRLCEYDLTDFDDVVREFNGGHRFRGNVGAMDAALFLPGRKFGEPAEHI